MINARNFFDQPVKNELRAYDNIQKIKTGQCDDYKIGCLLDYPYFEKWFELIAINLGKQQNLDRDLKAIQQIKFTGNLNRAEGATMFFIIEEANSFRFFKRNIESIMILFCFNIILI